MSKGDTPTAQEWQARKERARAFVQQDLKKGRAWSSLPYAYLKTIIAGSRTITDFETVAEAIKASAFPIVEVVSGAARGVDTLGEEWAEVHKIPIKRFPANWNTHGKKAGPLRNIEMAEYADALIAIWDGESRGTKHMIDEATKHGLQVFVYTADGAALMARQATKNTEEE